MGRASRFEQGGCQRREPARHRDGVVVREGDHAAAAGTDPCVQRMGLPHFGDEQHLIAQARELEARAGSEIGNTCVEDEYDFGVERCHFSTYGAETRAQGGRVTERSHHSADGDERRALFPARVRCRGLVAQYVMTPGSISGYHRKGLNQVL